MYILPRNVYNAPMISPEKQNWETDFEQCACTGRTLTRFVRPAVLALLAQAPAHGYDLLQRLREFKMFSEAPPDASGVYKTLRAMTDEGLVSGEWDTPDAGSARRPFTLKRKGRQCLAKWAATLDSYQKQLREMSAFVNAATGGKKPPKPCCKKRT